MSKEQEAAAEEAALDETLAADGADETLAAEGVVKLSETDALQQELNETKQRLLRTHADLENYRKRSSRELETERRYAAMPLLKDLLPVTDDIKRAIAAAEASEGDSGLLEGFRLVAQQLSSVLAKNHCTEIPAEGEEFDPNVHEAISYLPSADHEPNTVMNVTSTGYKLHDRIVRPSQVVVAAEVPKTDS